MRTLLGPIMTTFPRKQNPSVFQVVSCERALFRNVGQFCQIIHAYRKVESFWLLSRITGLDLLERRTCTAMLTSQSFPFIVIWQIKKETTCVRNVTTLLFQTSFKNSRICIQEKCLLVSISRYEHYEQNFT